MGDIGSAPVQQGPVIPPLDQEQEYEWKWRVSQFSLAMYRSRADGNSQRWRFRGELSFCRYDCIPLACIPHFHPVSAAFSVVGPACIEHDYNILMT